MDLESLKKQNVVVLGDAMVDRYVAGKVNRISPEAPIPVVMPYEDRDVLGGAANVVRNLCDFGGQSSLISIVGDADEGASVLNQLLTDAGSGLNTLVADPSRPTTSKTRVIGNGQQIVRIDREVCTPISGEVETELVKGLEMLFGKSVKGYPAAVIVADYAKGVVTPRVIEVLRKLSGQGVLVTVDPHPKNRQDWSGMSVFKPNLPELENLTGISVELKKGEDPRDSVSLRKAIDTLYQENNNKHLLITLSEFGMVYVYENREFHWEPTRAQEVFDVSGAGDTVISYFTMALAAGWSGVDATRLANVAAGLVVQKLGTASLSDSEIKEAWSKII